MNTVAALIRSVAWTSLLLLVLAIFVEGLISIIGGL